MCHSCTHVPVPTFGVYFMVGRFEDIQEANGNRKAMINNNTQYTAQKLIIQGHYSHIKQKTCTDVPKGVAVPAPLVTMSKIVFLMKNPVI